MVSFPDETSVIIRRYIKYQTFAVHLNQFRLSPNTHSHGSGGHMLNLKFGADGILPLFQSGSNRTGGSAFN